MVKYIATKRTNKAITLDQIKKTNTKQLVRHYHLEEKVENRHRYKSTKQERALIDIDLQRRLEDIHIEQRTDAVGTYFLDILELKRTQMATPAEKKFIYEATQLSQSLPQLIHNLDKVLELAYQYMKDKTSLLVLEVLTYLVKDCRQDFYPHLSQFLIEISKYLSIDDVTHLEKSFLLIAYAIKYLEKQIINDFENFIQVFNQSLFGSHFKAIRQLSSEALAYLYRKNRHLIRIQINEPNQNSVECLANAIFNSITALHEYLTLNSIKVIQQLWETDNEQLIINFYQLLINNVCCNKKQQLICLQEVFEDLIKRKINQNQIIDNIILQLVQFKNGKKITVEMLIIIIDKIESIEAMGLLLKQAFYNQDIQHIILHNQHFIDLIINKITCEQLLQIIEKIVDVEQTNPQLYRLIIAATFQQLFNQQINAIEILIKLDKLHCIDHLTPEKLDSFYNSSLFDTLLNSNEYIHILGLCKIYSLADFPELISSKIQNKLHSFLQSLEQKTIEKYPYPQEISKLKSLDKNNELELILSEQNQFQHSLEDGVRIRILQLLNDKSKYLQQFSSRTIIDLFSRSNLQLKYYIQTFNDIPESILSIGLMSRKRELRLICASKLSEIYSEYQSLKLMMLIDQEKCNLDNERIIKTQAINLKNLINKSSKEELLFIIRFIFGFAFTKFALLRSIIKELLSAILPKTDYLKVFLFQDNAQIESGELSYLEQYCYLQSEDEQLDSKIAFDEVFAPAILQADFQKQDKEILFDIAITNLKEYYEREQICNKVEDYYIRRYGDKKQQFYLKLLGSYINKFNETHVILHFLMKDDEQTQLLALKCLEQMELQQEEKEYHSVIKEFFDGARNLIDGKTFRSESVQFQIQYKVERYQTFLLYLLYPKLFSRIKLHKKKNKNYAIQIRRNATLELLSLYEIQDKLLNLIAENHGFTQNKDLSTIPISIKIQFLKIVKNLIIKFGFQITKEQVSQILSVIIKIFGEAYNLKQESSTSTVKELWKVSIKRFIQIIGRYQDVYSEETQKALLEGFNLECFIQGFTKIVEDSRFQASGLLKLLALIAQIEGFHPLMAEHHELLLSRFFKLYDVTYTKMEKVDDDGRLAFEMKKQTNQKLQQQKGVILYLNQIMFSIFQVKDEKSMEIEDNNLSTIIAKNYGEQILNYLFINLSNNCSEYDKFIILNNESIIQLFYIVLQSTPQVSQANQYLLFLVKVIKNPKVFDQGFIGKIVNNCINYLLKYVSEDILLINQLYDAYYHLIMNVKIIAIRIQVVNIILNMVQQFNSIYPINYEILKLLKDMNIRNMTSEEVDYSKSLEACLQLQQIKIQNDADLRALELILQNCFYLMNSEDLAIRIAIQEIFRMYLSQYQNNAYLDKYLLPQLIINMRSKEEHVVKLCFQILEIYLKYIQPDDDVNKLLNNEPMNATTLEFKTRFAEFNLLFAHKDPEQNLFNLIFDIQMPKRIKALQILETRLSQIPSILVGSYSQILLPLFDYYIFRDLNRIKMTEVARSHYGTIQHQACQLYGWICNLFTFEERIKVLQRLTRKLERQMLKGSNQVQALIKTISALAKNKDPNYDVVTLVKSRLKEEKSSQLQTFLQGYFQQEVEQNEEVMDFEFSYRNLIQQEKDLSKARESEQQKDQSMQLWNKVIDVSVNEMQEWQERSKILLKQIYHPLKNMFLLQKDDKNKLHLSFALIEIITQFPPDIFMTELNRLVQKLARGLKNRDNELREESRRCLLELSKSIGSTFLKFIIIQMRSVLTLGFENHVLAYTVSLLIEQSDSIDECIEDITIVFLDEIFGQVGKEKAEDSNLPKKTKEIKSKKGVQNFKMIGQMINFVNSLPHLLGVIDNYIQKLSISHELTSKLKLLFDHLYLGLTQNSTIPSNPIPILYLMIAETSHKIAQILNQTYQTDFTLNLNINKQKKLSKEEIFSIQLPSSGINSIVTFMKQKKLKTNSTIIFTQITLLAIKLLNFTFKQNTNNLQDLLLQRIFKVILDCLQYQEMVTECVQLLNILIRQCSWIVDYKKQVITNAMQSISKLTSTDEQAVRDSFSLLKAILDSKIGDFTTSQQKTLIHFIDLHLEQIEPLECLKLIVNQIWPIPQIYDLIIRVRENMLQNQKRSQTLSRQIYLQFIIKYPLSSQVLQQHFDFLLANLNYQYSTGRLAVYYCLQQIFDSFPSEVVNKLADISYFSLIVAYIKEDTNKIAVEEVLTTLIKHMPNDKIQTISKNSLLWMKNEKENVSMAGIESIRILKHMSNQLIETVSQFILSGIQDWSEWKSNIQARNIQQKNLKDTKWAEEIEAIQVTEYPNYSNRLECLFKLLLQFDENNCIKLYQQETLCNLIDFIIYPKQEISNMAMKLLINSKKYQIVIDSLKNQQELLDSKVYKIIKHQFFVKYIRQQVILDPELLNDFGAQYLQLIQQHNLTNTINQIFEAIKKISSNIFAKSAYFKTPLKNLVSFLIYILKNGVKPNDYIVEIFVRLQQFEIPEIEQINKLLEKLYGATEFVKIYSKINCQISDIRQQRKVEKKTQAVINPEQYNQERKERNVRKAQIKKIKLKMKRGKLPI